jgi:hypothetical protein
MGIGLIVTIVFLGGLLGLFARQALETDEGQDEIPPLPQAPDPTSKQRAI